MTRTCLLLGTLLTICSLAPAASVFNFDADTPDASTPFTDTDNGISATFSSFGDPGGFAIYASFFSTLTGNVLADPGPASLNNLPLSVALSTGVRSVDLLFAINGSTSDTFTLQAYAGATFVGSTSATGTIPAGFFFPEGAVGFNSSVPFDSLVLSSTGTDFAVDDIVVSTTPIPEPASLSLVGLALAGVSSAIYCRRR